MDNDYQHGSGSNIALVTETPNEYPTSYSPTTIATTIPHHELDSITNEGSSNIGIISRRSTTRSRGSTSATYDQPPATPRLGIGRVGTLSSLMKPKKPVGPAPSMFQSFRSVLTSSWINVLLLCIPVSWILHFVTPDSDTLIFIFSFFAIIPLAKLLAFATDELSMRVGQTLAGLMNATLGNAVELIVAIIALVQCKLQIVQSSLIGSMLSNLLLVLGMCFTAGGIRFSEQGFGLVASQLNASLLTIAVIALLLPAAFHFNVTVQSDSDSPEDILKVSHGVALILLFIYAAYLFFQLYSHASLYNDDHDTIKSTKYAPRPKKEKSKSSSLHTEETTTTTKRHHLNLHAHFASKNNSKNNMEMSAIPPSTTDYGRPSTSTSIPPTPTSTSTKQPLMGRFSRLLFKDRDSDLDLEKGTDGEGVHQDGEGGDSNEEEVPQMNVTSTVILLAVVAVLVSVTAEWLVDSIDGLTSSGVISQEFVGIILLPIVGNAAEHVTAVTVSVKDKLTLSLGVAVGSTLQIALFVIPFIVTLGWILGKPLTLLFDPYESITLFLAVLTVNYSVQDGKSNWLEGVILMCLYIILCVTFWYYPGSDPLQALTTSCN